MNILIISTHPDDETLGMGGTILKHKENGNNIYWLILTKSDESVGISSQIVSKALSQIESVGSAYGFKEIFQLDFITTKMHLIDFSQIVEKISFVILNVKPQIVYMPNRSDIHTDHQIAAKAIFSCTKAFRYPFIQKIMMYECLSETEIAPQLPENIFLPNCFSDISNYIEQKLEIMKLYETEIQELPFPRSLENIRALSLYRGASCCLNFAEAFMLVREVF